VPLLSDRRRRGAILLSTRALPRPLRVRVRAPLLGRLARGKALRADALFVRHAKAGSTWLRVLLFRLYQRRYDLPPRRVAKSDEMHRFDPRLPRFHWTNAHYSYESYVRRLFEEPVHPALREKRLVLLARHPCDLVPSWYHQLTRRSSAYRRELFLHSLAHPVRIDEVTPWEFAMHPELGLPNLIDYHDFWYRTLAPLPNARIVRYEDLRADPAGELARLAEFLGERFDAVEIDDAVEFASFENLGRLEREGFFENRGLSPRRGGPDAAKVRRGAVGGYREVFTPEQVEAMEALVRERLVPELGYGRREPPPRSEGVAS